jgi:PKD repeat protein
MKKVPIFLFFTLSLMIACKDLEKPILPTNDTVANFSFNPNDCNAICTTTFTNTSSGSGTLSYQWSFGDAASGNANISTLKDPTHEYKNAGNYEVMLTTVGANGSSEVKKIITISAPLPTFEKTYPGSVTEVLLDVAELADGSYISVGSTYDNSNNIGKGLIMKINNKGEKTSSYLIGDFDAVTEAKGIALTQDGGFFLGATVHPKTGNYEARIYKVSNTDVVSVAKVFTADYIELNALHRTSDGGCVFTGVKRQKSTDKNKIWAGRLDASGNTMFETTYDGWVGSDIIQTPDNKFVIVGQTEAISNKIIKIDEIGTKIWEDGPYSHFDYILPFGIAIAKDGSYLIGGDAQGKNLYYAYTASIATDKTVKWHKPFGGADFSFGRSVTTNTNGDVVLVGFAGTGANNDALFIKTDANGNNVVRRQFGGVKNEIFSKVITTKDGGYIMVGFSYSSDTNGDAYIVKTDKEGKI